MDFLFLLFQIFLIIFLGVYLGVGIFFSIRAIQTKLHHIIYGSVSFTLMAISQIIAFLSNLPDIVETILIAIAFVMCVIFTNLTFHKARKSSIPLLILIVTLINSIIFIIFNLLRDIADSAPLYYATIIYDFIYRSIIFGWLGWSSLKAYKKIKDKDIEPWIKARYKIVSAVSFLICFERIVRIFQPWYQEFGDPNYIESYIVFGIISIMAIIFALGFALAWFMPKWFKRYLNKGYQHVEDKEYSEEELLDIIEKQLSNGGNNGGN